MKIYHPIIALSVVILFGTTCALNGCRNEEQASPDTATELALLKERGTEDLKAGRFNDAYVAYKQASQIAMDDYDVTWGMAQTNSKLGNEVEAIDWIDLSLGLKPDSAEAMELKGRLYLRLGRIADATAILERTVKTHPEYVLGWLNLSAAYNVQGKGDKAVEAIENVLAHKPDDPVPYFAMGDIRARAKKYAEAEAYYLQAIEKDAEYGQAYLRLADIYIVQNKNLEQARKYAMKADELAPGDGTAASAAAWVLYLQNDKQNAIQEMIRAGSDHPQNYHIWMRLGKMFEEEGDQKNAEQAYKTAAQFAPRQVEETLKDAGVVER